MRALTVRQPWASLEIGGLKPVENRTWAVPSTLPQWGRCGGCDERVAPGEWHGDMHVVETGPTTGTEAGHAPDCMGWCEHCPVPVPVQLDPREPCGPVEPDGPFPFRLAIHAGQQDDPAATEAWEALARHRGVTSWLHGMATLVATLPRGALLGYVTVTGCHHADECDYIDERDGYEGPCSPWAERSVYHWTLAGPVALDKPIPYKGRQGLWTIPDDVLAEVPA